ncbi:MAG: hypothetical protein OXH46_00255 [Gemmatimonadetes bacterium]|nr:hypothetical protein [Gemmatimonadota bacterium]MCZ0936712.1 hypothetical protein [Candidatus Palauibacter rhopaloidicola]
MSEANARQRMGDDLAVIRRLMEDARETVSNNGWHYVLWGSVLAVAEVFDYWAESGALPVSPRVVWSTALGLGWGISILLRRWSRKHAAVDSLANRILGAIWIGCGLGLMLLGLCGAQTGTLPGPITPAVMTMPIGTAFFASSSLCDRALFRVLAISWWALGGAMLIWPHPANNLVMSAGLILFMAGPGFLLTRRAGKPARMELVA